MHYRITILLAILAPWLSGCASTQDAKFKATHCLRAHAASWGAPRAKQFNGDYKDGFVQGYYEYSLNRTCKAPSVPPKEYWKAKYQSPCGHQRIEAWYDGYEMGMLAAERDCGNCWHYYHPRGMVTCMPPLAYPADVNSQPVDELIPSDAYEVPPSKAAPKKSSESIPAPILEEMSHFDPESDGVLPTAYEERIPVPRTFASKTVEPTDAPASLSSAKNQQAAATKKRLNFDPPPLP